MALIQHHIEEVELEQLEAFLKRLEGTSYAQHIRVINALIVNHRVLTEQWIDPADQNVWTRPTPWAYAQVCKLRDKLQEQVKELERRQMSKYTQDQLKAAFEMVVENKDHWKKPIDTIVDDPGEENLACVREAIIHFTGSIPNIEKLEDGKVRITAAGYYMTIGA